MPDITMTRQTSLRGTALQNAINAMVSSMSRRSPFNLVPLQSRWESATRLTLSASPHVSGAIDIRDGNPSTVTAQVNLLSSTARTFRGQIESAMVEESQRNMPIVGAATAVQPSSTTAAQPSTTASSGRGDFDWNLFSTILGSVVSSAGTGLSSYNQAMGYTASTQAQQIAAETAQQAGVQVGPGFVLGPGKVVGPEAPPPGPTVVRGEQQLGPVVAPATGGMPTWGWVALGLGGAGLVAFVVWTAVTKHG